MSMPVRIDDTLYEMARAQAHAERRTIAGQIEFWAMIGKATLATPEKGEAKKGDLAGVFVYKFKCVGQLALLAYEYDPTTRLLLLLGSHENVYRDLKRQRGSRP